MLKATILFKRMLQNARMAQPAVLLSKEDIELVDKYLKFVSESAGKPNNVFFMVEKTYTKRAI